MRKYFSGLLLVVLLLPMVQVAADEIDPETWMTDASDEARSKLLSEFIIPGSHDALTYDLLEVAACSNEQRKGECNETAYIAELLPETAMPWAKAQDLTIKEQLEAGARSFDLRFFEVTQEWLDDTDPTGLRYYIIENRGIEIGDYITHHTVAGGVTSTRILADIRAFAEKNPREILILHFRKIEVEDIDAFFQHVSEGLDMENNVIRSPWNVPPWDKTVAELQEGPGNMVITYDKSYTFDYTVCCGLYILAKPSGKALYPYPIFQKYATEPALISLLKGIDGEQSDDVSLDNRATILALALGLPEDTDSAVRQTILNPMAPGSLKDIAAGPEDQTQYDCFGCGVNKKLVPALTALPRDRVNLLEFDYYSEDITREVAKLNEDPIRVAVHILKVEENDCNSSPFSSKPNCIDPSGYPDFYPKINFSPDEGWGEWGGVELENTDRWADSDKGNGDPKPSDKLFNDWTPILVPFDSFSVQIGPWIARRVLDITETSVEVDIKIRDEDYFFFRRDAENDRPTMDGRRRSIVRAFDLSGCVADPDDCGLTRKTYTTKGSKWEYGCDDLLGCSDKAGIKVTYLVQVCRWSSCPEITDADDWIDGVGENEAPAAILDRDAYTIDEGSLLTVDGNGSADPDDDPLTYDWALVAPLSCVDVSEIPASEPRIQADYVCADDETFEIQLTVSDEEFSDQALASVTVNNVAPTATIDAITDFAGNVLGEDVHIALVHMDLDINISFMDVGALDTHVVKIDWADGTVNEAPATSPVSNAHAYMTAGNYSIVVTVTDDDGGTVDVTKTIEVVDAAGAVDDAIENLSNFVNDPTQDPKVVGLIKYALGELNGKQWGWWTASGALAMLEKGNWNSALTKISKAIALLRISTANGNHWIKDLSEETREALSVQSSLLALAAKSTVVVLMAVAEEESSHSHDLRKIRQAKALMAKGDERFADGKLIAAVGYYRMALHRLPTHWHHHGVWKHSMSLSALLHQFHLIQSTRHEDDGNDDGDSTDNESVETTGSDAQASDNGNDEFQEPVDSDNDGIADEVDNCVVVHNMNQLDTDGDGYGNRCDADFNNDGTVNFSDWSRFKGAFNTLDYHADLDGNGLVNFADLAIFKDLFNRLLEPRP